MTVDELTRFIVRAKSATWNADGAPSLSYRPASHDLQYHEEDLAYLDSYFGSADFVGQEVVWSKGVPVWAMNYHGRVLRPDRYDGARAGAASQFGRGRVYATGTFLGSHDLPFEDVRFRMETAGDPTAFSGAEWHERDGLALYRFEFHGGTVRE